MISIQNVSKWFGKFKAVDNINIEVEKGEIFGLLGLNGAGKTTTQRMVSTVFQPSEGNIIVNGFDSKINSSEVRRNIGFLPTEVGLYDRLTSREVIRYFGILNDIDHNQIDDKINDVLERLSLSEYADKRCGKLSRGNKQKVAIARAIKSVNAGFIDGVNGFEVEKKQFGECFGTDEFKEGITAFMEKRKANF